MDAMKRIILAMLFISVSAMPLLAMQPPVFVPASNVAEDCWTEAQIAAILEASVPPFSELLKREVTLAELEEAYAENLLTITEISITGQSGPCCRVAYGGATLELILDEI